MALVCFFLLISTLYACLLVICSLIFKLLHNSLNFEAKINLNTTTQNDLKWRKTCIGLKFDLEHFMALRPNLFVTVYWNTLYKGLRSAIKEFGSPQATGLSWKSPRPHPDITPILFLTSSSKHFTYIVCCLPADLTIV